MGNVSPAAVLIDELGNFILVDSEGGRYALVSKDEEQLGLLRGILLEMKKLNVQLADITGNTISDDDEEM